MLVAKLRIRQRMGLENLFSKRYRFAPRTLVNGTAFFIFLFYLSTDLLKSSFACSTITFVSRVKE